MRFTAHTQTLRRTAVATFAAAGLVLGAAACGDDSDDGTVEVEETVEETETEVVEEEVTETLEPTDTQTETEEVEVETTETETNTDTVFEEDATAEETM